MLFPHVKQKVTTYELADYENIAQLIAENEQLLCDSNKKVLEKYVVGTWRRSIAMQTK